MQWEGSAPPVPAQSPRTGAAPNRPSAAATRARPAVTCTRALFPRAEDLGHPAEELIEHHLGHAAQHPLADAGDETADLDVGVIGDARAALGVGELHRGIPANEAWASGTLDRHPVAVRRLEIAEPHLALERSLDGGHADIRRDSSLIQQEAADVARAAQHAALCALAEEA